MGTEFSFRTRDENLKRFERETFDLFVIGGGITGAGIARDAALRGLSVGLADRGDFASGTSGKSSRLIHGGFRYLTTYDFGLVFESCRERHTLLNIAPHLVRPLEFLYPFYGLSRFGLLHCSAGLLLYDAMALFRNVRRHRMLSPAETLSLEPAIRRAGLSGAALYHDCLTDDVRLTLATVKSAHRAGAVAANHVEVASMAAPRHSVWEIGLRDKFSGARLAAHSRMLVNAAGPWIDQVRQLAGPQKESYLSPSKGTHLVLRRGRLGTQRAAVFHSPDDGRVLFAIPSGAITLVGTTEVSPPTDCSAADAPEVDYLLKAANDFFPEAKLGVADILCTYSGLRPLLKSDRANPSDASRKHGIFEEEDGLISVGGGKLTTYRLMAEQVVDRVLKRLGHGGRRCPTSLLPLFDGSPAAHAPEEWINAYGPEADAVKALRDSVPALGEQLVPGLTYEYAQVDYALESEMAMAVDDVLVRRIPIFYEEEGRGLGCLEQVAGIMAEKLGWTAARRSEEMGRYQSLVESSRAGRKTS